MALPETAIAVTIDVEWAADEVLADIVALLDERSITATFFCTHDGIQVDGHERAIHPNFRWNGDSMKQLRSDDEDEVSRAIVLQNTASYPDAVGTRAHYLRLDTGILSAYADAGLRYDSSYLAPLQAHLRPASLPFGIVEFPIYYMDHLDLMENTTGFRARALDLSSPGLKVLAFHPNMVFINAPDDAYYQTTKDVYSDPQALIDRRFAGRGIRDLFVEVLDVVAAKDVAPMPLARLLELAETRARNVSA